MKTGKYKRLLLSDYTVLDTETTGLDFYYNDMIEIALLKIRNGKIYDKFQSLINPNYKIPDYITEFTGITNEMLQNAPTMANLENDILNFISGEIIVGHNTYFDMNFLANNLTSDISNDYVDTMQFCRKLYPELKHHRLIDMTEYLGLYKNTHRAMDDCISTYELYETIKNKMDSENISIKDIFAIKRSKNRSYKLSEIKPTTFDIDEESFFFGKYCCFTGKLEKMVRKDAMQIVVNLGGHIQGNVNSKTNYLILGTFDFRSNIKGDKSRKYIKAESNIAEGLDTSIISEDTFYRMIGIEEGS